MLVMAGSFVLFGVVGDGPYWQFAAALVLLGLGFRLRDASTIGLLALVALFQLVTTPIGSHMVGRASFRGGQVRHDLLVVDELTDVLSREQAHAVQSNDQQGSD